MTNTFSTMRFDHVIALLFVFGLHAAAFYLTMYYQPTLSVKQPPAVFVSLINAPQKEEVSIPEPAPPEPPKPQPKKIKRIKKARPKPLPIPVQALVEDTQTTVFKETPIPEPIADDSATQEEAPAAPEQASSPAPEQRLPASIDLTSELSLACKHRTPPNYPNKSIQLGEQGRVVLHVSLDETGRISAINIKTSSGHSRLDKAGITAIKSWRCNAAKRNGKSIPSTALQPFDFILD